MRHVIIDIETTGIQRSDGHRIVEFAALEMIGGELTGEQVHFLINPERDIPAEVTSITGIKDEDVKNQPKFSEFVENIDAFIRGSTIIAHNAPFDIKFLEHEFKLCGIELYILGSIDTLALAKRKYPKQKVNLSSLADILEIDKSIYQLHNALDDCYLLAQIYPNLN